MGDDEKLEFKWLQARGFGGKKKDIRFFQSFSFDGVEYALYDNVYLYKDDEPEPYIGKLIKIWEHSDKSKKVKVLWYFRPCEILNFLGTEEPQENELFLASGEGVGLANINLLEAIAGKCNVVCTSKDARNFQPSDEELQSADFVFYRTFDVGKREISENFDEKIALVDISNIFNRPADQNTSSITKPDSENKEGSEQLKPDLEKKEGSEQPKIDSEMKEGSEPKIDSEMKEGSEPKIDSEQKEVSENATLLELNSQKKEVDEHVVTNGELLASSEQNNFEAAIPTDKSNIVKHGDDKNEAVPGNKKMTPKSKVVKQKSSLGENKPASSSVAEACETSKTNSAAEKTYDSKTLEVDGNINEDSAIKNVEVEEKCAKVVDEADSGLNKKAKSEANGKKPTDEATASENKSRLKRAKSSLLPDNVGRKKLKSDEKLAKLPDVESPKESSGKSPKEEIKTESQTTEVSRKPDDERSKWFKGLPWEERLKSAHEEGTLVLLQNLDPFCTSSEVEDIVWHAFKEKCSAKRIQKTALASPHSGLAYIILKSRDAVENIVKKLDEGSLMLSNGRILVGCVQNPCFPGKHSTFPGHLVLDKLKFQSQRDMKEAVSTSHCAQPNTLEFEMAVDWSVLQERSDNNLKKLFQQHGEELKNLKGKLKSK